jgi:hypothetical protein
MTTVSLQFKEAEKHQIEVWLDYLRSLDFIQTIKVKEEQLPYLLIEDIKQQYPNQWVLLANTKVEGINILGGRVILHSTDKRELALKGRDMVKDYTQVRHFYTGEMPHQKHIGLIVRRDIKA